VESAAHVLGAPSLDGQWSVDDMRGIPAVRPETFGTRDSLTQEEFMQRGAPATGRRRSRAQGGTFLRNEWARACSASPRCSWTRRTGACRSSQRRPRRRPRRRTAGHVQQPGRLQQLRRLTLYDRCITRGIFGSVLPSIYGNGIRITQDRTRCDQLRNDHDTRVVDLSDKKHLEGDIEQ